MSWADSVISSTLASIADDHAQVLDERRRPKASAPFKAKTRSAAADVRGRDAVAQHAPKWEWVNWRKRGGASLAWVRASLARAGASAPSQCSANGARAAVGRLTLRQNLFLLVIGTVTIGLVAGVVIGKGMVSALAPHRPASDAQARARILPLVGDGDEWTAGLDDARASAQLRREEKRADVTRQQRYAARPRNHIGMTIGCFERGYYCCGRIQALPAILHAEIIGAVEVEVCHMLCQQTPSCHVFSWRAADGACHLKPADPGRFKRGKGHLSAAKNCTLPGKAALQRLTDSVDPAQPPLLRGGVTHAATRHGVGGTSLLHQFAVAAAPIAPIGGVERGHDASALAAALLPAAVLARPGGAPALGVSSGGTPAIGARGDAAPTWELTPAAAAVPPTATAIADAAAGTMNVDPFGPRGALGGNAQMTALSSSSALKAKQAPPSLSEQSSGLSEQSSGPFAGAAALDPFAGQTPRGGAADASAVATQAPPSLSEQSSGPFGGVAALDPFAGQTPRGGAADASAAATASPPNAAAATAAAVADADPNSPFAFGSAAAQPFR